MKRTKKLIKSIFVLLTLGFLVSCGDSGFNTDYSMKAIVESVGNGRLEVTVYDAEYAEGTYSINFDGDTKFLNANGKKITVSDIAVGDKVEIFYGGQVMLSYPPQIYASKIRKL